jgi:hypothetical protein
MLSDILWAYVARDSGAVIPSPLVAPVDAWPLRADEWFALLACLGFESNYRRQQLNPLDWQYAVFWKTWNFPRPFQDSIDPSWLLTQLVRNVHLPDRLEEVRQLAKTELGEADRRGLRLIASFGPLSSWNPNCPLDGENAGFTQIEIDVMVACVRSRIDERIVRRKAKDAAGVCAMDDPLMLARRRADGLDDERFYREEFERFAPESQRIEFTYVLAVLRADSRREARTVMWLQVGQITEWRGRRHWHQIWVLHHDGEWYRVGG